MLGFKLREEGPPNLEPCVMMNELSFSDLIALTQYCEHNERVLEICKINQKVITKFIFSHLNIETSLLF